MKGREKKKKTEKEEVVNLVERERSKDIECKFKKKPPDKISKNMVKILASICYNLTLVEKTLVLSKRDTLNEEVKFNSDCAFGLTKFDHSLNVAIRLLILSHDPVLKDEEDGSNGGSHHADLLNQNPKLPKAAVDCSRERAFITYEVRDVGLLQASSQN
jgi:hypothetical protein